MRYPFIFCFNGNNHDMIKGNSNVFSAKEIINSMAGKKVSVKVDLGRNKREEFVGILTGVYPALFTVSPINSDYKGKTSYSYAEYICGDVAIKEYEKRV